MDDRKGLIFFPFFSLILLKFFTFVKVMYKHSLVNLHISHSCPSSPLLLPEKVAVFSSVSWFYLYSYL